TNDVTSRAAIGEKCKDQVEFTSLLRELIQKATAFNLADLYPSVRFLRYATGMQTELKKMKKKLDKILGDIVNKHRMKAKSRSSNVPSVRENLIDLLLKIQESNQLEMPLTTDHIKGVTMVSLETLAILSCLGMHLSHEF